MIKFELPLQHAKTHTREGIDNISKSVKPDKSSDQVSGSTIHATEKIFIGLPAQLLLPQLRTEQLVGLSLRRQSASLNTALVVIVMQ